MVSLCFLISGCSGFESETTPSRQWSRNKDACVFTSNDPPMRRIVNYVDEDLCSRPKSTNRPRRVKLRDHLN